jgi:hypothetical protein
MSFRSAPLTDLPLPLSTQSRYHWGPARKGVSDRSELPQINYTLFRAPHTPRRYKTARTTKAIEARNAQESAERPPITTRALPLLRRCDRALGG